MDAGHLLPVGREDHRPRYAGRPAIELTVDEISESPEEESRSSGQCQRVRDLPEGHTMHPRKERAGGGHADHGPMEGEPAMPESQELDGIVEIVAGLVEDRVRQSGPGEHPHHEVADQRIEIVLRHRDHSASDARARDAIPDDVPDEVHDAVPADRDRADPHDLRRDVGIRDGHRRALRGVSPAAPGPRGTPRGAHRRRSRAPRPPRW